MDTLVSGFVVYGGRKEFSVLHKLASVTRALTEENPDVELLNRTVNDQVKALLELGTDYGFDRNLWQCYLTYLLIMDENPFTRICEKNDAPQGSVLNFINNDLDIFRSLFHYDFSKMEEALGRKSFSILCDYKACKKEQKLFHRNISAKVCELSAKLDLACDDADAFFRIVTDFYKAYGVGEFGLNKAFRIYPLSDDTVRFQQINNMDPVTLDDLVGYEIQKQKLIENTKAFVDGKKANNALLFGDSGTGKSTCIKAIINQFYDDGLRMIEVYKHQFQYLSQIIAQIKNRNYKFIIYMDDLSFEDFETEYKFLKAVIEGGVETKPDNVLIYATSNRRHLIKETWADRDDVVNDNGIHKSDTIQEKLSLAYRFGVTISFSKPTQKEFYNIAVTLAHKAGITLSEEEICRQANMWELSHGGISGRTAQQFITYLAAKEGGTDEGNQKENG